MSLVRTVRRRRESGFCFRLVLIARKVISFAGCGPWLKLSTFGRDKAQPAADVAQRVSILEGHVESVTG